MPEKTINLEVISDWVCPWCYVGKRRLEAALAERPDLDVTLAWQPFQLSPDIPREGLNRQDYYQQIFGPERAAMIVDRLKQTGEEEGISFGSHADAMAPNTLSAHVLMYWASADDGLDANDLAEKLFHAHHVDCEDIGDHTVLTRIAGEVGMDADEVAKRLAGREDETLMKEHITNSKARGVSGVPFFVINGQHGLSGAQPSDVLLSAFEQIASGESG
ncbi:MAG: disulfide bond formation protein DsbA [Chromatiales bacterium]|jgi:predicted DsbA family dithiol-disulfide isomerase|nr:disulfide bond formation protein DsbA [Chromatiales bacterium]